MKIRTIRPDDHDRVGALTVDAYDAVGPFDAPYRRFLRDPGQWVSGATSVFVAADIDDIPIGSVAFVLPGDREFEGTTPPAGDAGFRFLAVDVRAQGSGAGAALVARCVDAAREHGCRRLAIHSMSFMTRAHELYLRRGFVRRPDLDVTFPSGIGIAFTLDLTDDAADAFPAPGPVITPPPWFGDAWGLDVDRPDDAATATPC